MKASQILKKGLWAWILTTLGLMQAQAAPPDTVETQLMRYQNEIDAIIQRDSLTPPPDQPVVFAGSSSFRLWTTLSQDMRGLPVLNNGFGGSTFPELIFYIPELVVAYKPSAVFLYEGDNDLTDPSVTPDLVLERLMTCHAYLQELLPGLPTYVVSIKPSPSRADKLPLALEANRLMAAYAARTPYLEFIDVTTPMLDAKGRIRKELFSSDDLHMNEKGYQLWTSILFPHVAAAYMSSPPCE